MKRHFSVFARISLLLLALQLPAMGQPIFVTAPSYPVGNIPGFSTTGDFNGDGKLDVAVTNGLSNTVSVLLGNGDGTLQPAVNYPAGNAPQGIAVADLNGDGKLDIVVADQLGGLSVLLGNGDGTFGAPASFTAGTIPFFVLVADLNGDSKPDLIVTNEGDGTVSVLLGNGNGTFKPAVSYTVGGTPLIAVLADVTGDGKPDLLVSNFSGNVSLLPGNGDGTFQAAQTITTGGPTFGIAVADLNGDGKPDVVTTNLSSTTINVMLATGGGAFQSPVNYFPGGNEPVDIHILDANKDGKLDLVVANGASNDAGILLGNGDGTFQPAMGFLTGSGALMISSGDLNGDGNPDLISSNGLSNSITVLIGNGNGTFQSPRDFQAHFVPVATAVGDLNGDGFGDVVMANAGSNDVSVFMGNGDATFKPIVNYPVGNGPSDVALADFNGDGKLDIVAVNSIDNSVSILFGNGDGTFQPSVTYTIGTPPPSAAFSPIKLLVGHFSSQSALDVVTQDSNTGDVVFMQGNAIGTLNSPIKIESATTPVYFGSTDFSGDGQPDLVIANGTKIDTYLVIAGPKINMDLAPFNSPFIFAASNDTVLPIATISPNPPGSAPSSVFAGFANSDFIRSYPIGTNGTVGASTEFPTPAPVSRVRINNIAGNGVPGMSFVYNDNNPNNIHDALGMYPGDGQGGFKPLVNLFNLARSPFDALPFNYSNILAGAIVANQFQEGFSTLVYITASAPKCGITPTTMDFGAVDIGSTSATHEGTITNTGNIQLQVLSSSENGPDFNFFFFFVGTLQPGQQLAFGANFAPWPGPGLDPQLGTLTFSTNAVPACPVVTLSGTPIDNIAPHIIDIAPTSGEKLRQFNQYNITFAASDNNAVATVEADFSPGAGKPFTQIAIVPGTSSNMPFTVPDIVTKTAEIQLIARDPSGNSTTVNSGPFSIGPGTPSEKLKEPDFGDNWGIGTQQVIKWIQNEGMGVPNNIYLSIDGGTTFNPIASNVPNNALTTGSFVLTVPGQASNTAQIKVVSVGSGATGTSSTFTIAPAAITLKTPKTWKVGTTVGINYKSNLGPLDTVNGDLSLDGGVTFPISLFTGAPTSGTQKIVVQAAWVTPTAVVRVSSVANPSESAISSLKIKP